MTVVWPRRALGALVAGVPAVIAVALAAAVTVKASGWPISFPQFLAYGCAAALVALAAVFLFWSYACATLRYVLDRSGLTIVWGPLRHFVPLHAIKEVVHGRGEHRPRVRGLSWWGHHVGRGEARGLGEAIFYSTHRAPEELVYVRTASATYAVNPRDPTGFIARVQRLQQQTARPEGEAAVAESVQRDIVSGHPIWADRAAQWLTALAVLANLALWGYVFAVYPDLDPQITIEFPPLGDITELHSRQAIFRIPAFATAVLAVNLLVGLGFHWRERAATYLLLSATVFFQVVFLVAAGVAVGNA